MKKLIILALLIASVNYGQVGIGTTNPSAMLHVGGDVKIDDLQSTSTTNVVADTDGKLIARQRILGIVNANGTAIAINGASVSRTSNGIYRVDFNPPLSTTDYVVLLTTINPTNSDAPIIHYYGNSVNGFNIRIKDAYLLYDINIQFSFKVEIIN